MSKWVEELYDDTFDATVAENGLLFVDFYADWCGPCRAVAPVVERLAKEYAGRVKFAKVNTDGNPETARRMRISNIPALILFSDGKPVSRTGGYQSDAKLRALLDRHAPPPAAALTREPARKRGALARMFGRG